MTCKAYNGRVVTEWLADALRRCHPSANDARMACAYACVSLGAVSMHAWTDLITLPTPDIFSSFRIFCCGLVTSNLVPPVALHCFCAQELACSFLWSHGALLPFFDAWYAVYMIRHYECSCRKYTRLYV